MIVVKPKQFYLLLRLIIIFIPLITLGYFTWRYIDPDGILEVNYDFCRKETAFFSGLSPQGRVLDIEELESYKPSSAVKCFQRMVIDPVYFDVRLPQTYRWAEIGYVYKKSEGQPLSIGVRTSQVGWAWQFGNKTKSSLVSYSRESETVSEMEEGTANWREEAVEIDLAKAVYVRKRLRFIISAPGLDQSGQEIVLANIKIKFVKEPVSRENFIPRLKNMFK